MHQNVSKQVLFSTKIASLYQIVHAHTMTPKMFKNSFIHRHVFHTLCGSWLEVSDKWWIYFAWPIKHYIHGLEARWVVLNQWQPYCTARQHWSSTIYDYSEYMSHDCPDIFCCRCTMIHTVIYLCKQTNSARSNFTDLTTSTPPVSGALIISWPHPCACTHSPSSHQP